MKHLSAIITAIITALFVFPLISCDNNALSFSEDTIYATVGEYVDIADYVKGDFKMTVSDELNVICDTVVYASEPVRASVIVFRGAASATAEIVVQYAQDEVFLSCEGDPFTTEHNDITFNAGIKDGCDPSKDIIWKKDGTTVGVGQSYTLSFTPYTYEKHVITALFGTSSAAMTAVYYKEFSTPPTLELRGDEIVEGEAVIALNEAASSVSPLYIQWFVDGTEYECEESTLTLSDPKAGEHTVYAKVNGVRTDDVSFIVCGKAEIHGAYIDFDSAFPSVFLRWEGADCEYNVQVGDETYYSVESERFSGHSFDLTSLIDIGEAFDITLSCEGNEYYDKNSKTIHFDGLDDNAIKYLSASYPFGNYYLGSLEEAEELISYAMTFRPGGEKTVINAYIGYESEMSPAVLLSLCWARTEQTGRYILHAGGDKEVTFEINFLTVNVPNETDVSLKTKYPSLITPVFEGGATLNHSEGQVTVFTSEELYFTVQKGYSPSPEEGSAAARILNKATAVLEEIIAPDYDAEQKVRAIYEWVMYNTVYDYEVLNETDLTVLVAEPAFYLEGVFDDGFAVCDGIAKSVSLLCNLAGVSCVRVVGKAELNRGDIRHAWNKVFLDGNWYIIDATWGDGLIAVNDRQYEGGLHNYYLKTDGEMFSHKATFPDKYPLADTVRDWYREQGKLIDMDLIVFGQKISEAERSMSAETDFYCVEFKVTNDSVSFYKNGLDSVIAKAVREAVTGEYKRVSLKLTDNILLVLFYR